jgi:outer membrane protein assembly factor BamB
MKRALLTFILIIFITGAAFSQGYDQWRGPERDGIYPEQGLLKEWPKEGPALLWKAENLGKGFSSAVSDGRMVYVSGMKDSTDYLSALDMKGELLWQVPFGPSWNQTFNPTRTTPTVDNGLIYVISGLGTIACVDASVGQVKWSFDAYKKFGGACGTWGVCESPLVVDDKVIYTPAGEKTTMVALNKLTGETVWTSETLHDTSAYVSPRLIRSGNGKIIVTIINKYFIGVDPGNGKILWKVDFSAMSPEKGMTIWPGAPKTNTNTPLYKEDLIYITGGYNHIGAMFRITGDAAGVDLVWTDTILDCHHGGVVLIDGYIYGSNWIDNARGNWCCIEWKSGKAMYEQNWHTKGSIIFADGLLYCYDEKDGNIGLVRPDPLKFDLVSSFKVPFGKGPHWSHPEIIGGVLYIRHGEVLMAYDLRKKTE